MPNARAAQGASATTEERIAALAERCRMLEEQLRQAQKLATLGVVASGIAHDFNNLLTGILGYSDLLKGEINGSPAAREALEMIEAAASQAAHLTGQMLLLARGGHSERVAVDLHQVLRQVIELLGVGAVKRVRFETHFCCDNRLEIEAEPTQIFQVFLNLGLNARDAVNPDGVVAFRSELAEDGKVRLSVADDGPGIPESIRDRIFEPFFTTKDAAQGTGIGLAVVQRIVREHGGEIELDSTPGAGSRFSVVLPLGSCRPAEAPVQAGAATP